MRHDATKIVRFCKYKCMGKISLYNLVHCIRTPGYQSYTPLQHRVFEDIVNGDLVTFQFHQV